MNNAIEMTKEVDELHSDDQSTILMDETIVEETILSSASLSSLNSQQSETSSTNDKKRPREEHKQDEKHPKRKKPKLDSVYPYGNYPNYYNVRYRNMDIDPRIQIIQKNVKDFDFIDKRCLDIGCNTGFFTIQLAANFNLSDVHGIDIDPGLIRKAKKNLTQMIEDQSTITQQLSVSNIKNQSDQNTQRFVVSTNQKLLASDELTQRDHLSKVHFSKCNIVTDENIATERYDVICCMSVSKWIHLNYGDEGIKLLFNRVYTMLNPGGLFVFEPQLWKSYTHKQDLTKRMEQIFKTIQLRPTHFDEYLQKTVGFTRSATYFACSADEQEEKGTKNQQKPKNKKGAKARPICVYYK